MSCDFIVFYKICVEYEDENKTRKLFEYELDDTVEERYWNIDDRDHRTESICDFYERALEDKIYCVERALENLSKQDIYKHKMWMCDQYKKQNYLSLISKNNIKEDSVIAIWKQPDYQML